ncbi:Small heat shock protein, chloroplastic (Fragment) [Linum perenne]
MIHLVAPCGLHHFFREILEDIWEGGGCLEGESDYKLRFDIPGMGKSDVKVWVEDNMLVLKGEKAVNSNNENGSSNDGEWLSKSYGKYSYRIALPDNIEFEKIKAEVKDGVLYVTIPKAHTTCKVLDIDIE